MARKMRRARQQLCRAACEEILVRGTEGVLALVGDDGWPYAVPVNYAWYEGAVWFHSARKGHKIDAIVADGRASFCVIDAHDLVPEKYTTRYRSVIVFGRARIVEEEAERGLRAFAQRLGSTDPEILEAEMRRCPPSRVAMIRLDPEYITGKEAIELVRLRG